MGIAYTLNEERVTFASLLISDLQFDTVEDHTPYAHTYVTKRLNAARQLLVLTTKPIPDRTRIIRFIPKSTTEKPKINESSKIPAPIVSKILEIHRKGADTDDINLDGMDKNTQLWTRIQDIAYGFKFYKPKVLKELKEIIQSVPSWRYKNPIDKVAQEKWDVLIKKLNRF